MANEYTHLMSNDKYQPLVARSTVTSSLLNLIKNVIASGLVALPITFAQSSVLIAFLLMGLVGLFSAISFILLAKSSLIVNRFTYKEIAVAACGPLMGPIVQVVLIVYTFFTCVSFIVLVGDFVPGAAENFFSGGIITDRTFLIVMCSLIFIFPLIFMMNLDPLRFTSTFGVICVCYASVLVVIKEIIFGGIDSTVTVLHLETTMFTAIPVMTVAFAAHYNGPKFFEELGADLGSFRRVISIETVIVFVVYAGTGLAGYFNFGKAVNGDVILSFSVGDYSALVARIALGFSVIFTFPLVFHPLRKNLEQFVFNDAQVELITRKATDSEEQRVRRKTLLIHISITVGLFALAVFIGIMLPTIETVLAFKGSLLGSFVIYIFPGLFYFRLASRRARSEDPINVPSQDVDGIGLLPHTARSDNPVDSPRSMESIAHLITHRDRVLSVMLIVFGIVTGIMGFSVTAYNTFSPSSSSSAGGNSTAWSSSSSSSSTGGAMGLLP